MGRQIFSWESTVRNWKLIGKHGQKKTKTENTGRYKWCFVFCSRNIYLCFLSLLGDCDFDHNSLCSWRNEKILDHLDWKIRKGPTVSVNTGPTNDNSGENKCQIFNTASVQVSSEMFSRTFSTRSSPTLSSSYIRQLLDEVFVIPE